MSTLRLLSDIPVGLTGDGLGFGAYGKALASAIKATDDPLTIGIYGEWGSGKSSLMGMIKETLDEDRFTYLEWTPKTPHDILRLVHEASAVKGALR